MLIAISALLALVVLAAVSFEKPMLGIVLFIAIFPFFPIYVLVPVAGSFSLSIIEIMSAGIFIPIVLRNVIVGKKFILNRMDFLIILFIVVKIFIEFTNRGSETATGMQGVIHNLLIPFLPYYAISRSVRNKEDLKLLLVVFILGSIPFTLLGYVENITKYNVFLHMPLMGNSEAVYWGAQDFRGGLLRIKTSFGHPLSFGTYISAIILITLASIREIAPRKFRKARYLYVVSMLPLLFFAQARGAIIITAVLIVLYYLSQLKLRYFVGLAFFMVAAALAVSLVFPEASYVLDPNASSVSHFFYRTDLWSTALSALGKVSLFGVADISQVTWLPPQLTVDIVSWYLQSLVFRGLLFFLIHMAMVGFSTIVILRLIKADRFNMILGMGIFAFLLNYFNVSFVGTSPIVFWVVFALLPPSEMIFQNLAWKERPVRVAVEQSK